jgi:Domain of unknown function (DUF2017)
MVRRRRLLRRRNDGAIEVAFPDWLREEIGNLLGQLRQLMTTDAPADDRLERLFPPAYPDDAEAEAEYQGFMRVELVSSRLAAIDKVEATLFDEQINDEQLTAWMAAINDVRLVLGTLLGVTEEMDHASLDDKDPNFGGFLLYDQLTFVLGEIIEVLETAL